MSAETMTDISGIHRKSTTARRELLGWLGSMVWLYTMIYAYDIFLLDDMAYFVGSWVQFFFMMLLALSIAVFGRRFARDPDGLATIAFYTTPIVIGITVALGILPRPFSTVLYLLAAVLMAPVITRRVYGVIRTSEPNRVIFTYTTGFSAGFVAFAAWIILHPPKELAFLIPAIFAVPAWIGVRRHLSIPDEVPTTKAFRLSKSSLLMIIATSIVLLWVITMGRYVLTHVFAGIGETSSPIIDTLLAWIPSALMFLVYAVIGDKGHDRIGIICGMCLCLIGILLSILSGNSQGVALLPLIFTFIFGEIYAEYFAFSIPLHFLKNTERPVFVASIGCVFYLIVSAVTWKGDVWVPNELEVFDTPLLVSAGISCILFIILVYFLFERHREKTLAAALYALLHSGYKRECTDTLPSGDTDTPPEQTNIMNELFTPEEIDVALLLIEGKTRSDIIRKLHLSAADANQRMDAIRGKISGMGGFEPIIAAIVKEYKLTRRETDMLHCLRQNMTNAEIASELYLSEETVRIHVRNLLKKLPVESRQEVAAWIQAFQMKTE